MSNLVTKIGTKGLIMGGKVRHKVKNFLKDERSKNTFVDEGYLTYMGIAIGIVVLAIFIVFVTRGFNVVGNGFIDGVAGEKGTGDLGKWNGTGTGFIED